MSQENVKIVRRIYDVGDPVDWDAVFRDASQDFEVTFKAGPNVGTHRGRDAVQAALEDLRSRFELWTSVKQCPERASSNSPLCMGKRIRP